MVAVQIYEEAMDDDENDNSAWEDMDEEDIPGTVEIPVDWFNRFILLIIELMNELKNNGYTN